MSRFMSVEEGKLSRLWSELFTRSLCVCNVYNVYSVCVYNCTLYNKIQSKCGVFNQCVRFRVESLFKSFSVNDILYWHCVLCVQCVHYVQYHIW